MDDKSNVGCTASRSICNRFDPRTLNGQSLSLLRMGICSPASTTSSQIISIEIRMENRLLAFVFLTALKWCMLKWRCTIPSVWDLFESRERIIWPKSRLLSIMRCYQPIFTFVGLPNTDAEWATSLTLDWTDLWARYHPQPVQSIPNRNGMLDEPFSFQF